MSANSIGKAQFGLLPPVANPFCANLICKHLVQLHLVFVITATKGIGALLNAVSSIFRFASKLEMPWVAASSIVARWTLVKDQIAFWNWASKQNPTHHMRTPGPILSCRVELAVAVMRVAFPKPALIWTSAINQRLKSFVSGWGNALRGKVIAYNLWLYDVILHSYIVPALGGYWPRRGTLYFRLLTVQMQANIHSWLGWGGRSLVWPPAFSN